MAAPAIASRKIKYSPDVLSRYFLKRFEALSPPRSVSEACLTEEEFQLLRHWFQDLDELPARWCASGTTPELPLFGGLLLILAAEVCRDLASEDEVWPAIRMIFEDTETYPVLFSGGQPTPLCKKAIEAGARHFKLRHVFQRGEQLEYYKTLKLQYGFTARGASHRLGSWLEGNGTPWAIRVLTGDDPDHDHLASSSFQKLWTEMKRLRQGGSGLNDIASSCWLRPEFAPVFQEAPVPSGCPRSTSKSEDLVKPVLYWPDGEAPRLQLHFDGAVCDNLLGEVEQAIVMVDGRVADRWLRMSDGSWRGKTRIECPFQAERLEIYAADGASMEDIDLARLGLSAPFTLFDRVGRFVSAESNLDGAREYSVMCDDDIEFRHLNPEHRAIGKAFYRIELPDDGAIAYCQDGEFWRPSVRGRIDPAPAISITCDSQTVPGIGGRTVLRVSGIPEGATFASVLVKGHPRTLVRNTEQVWTTAEPVALTLRLLLGQQRARVRVIEPERPRPRTFRPRLNLLAKGIACSEPEWEPIKNGELNRRDGRGWARVFTPWSDADLYEGDSRVARGVGRALSLEILRGWGATLVAEAPDSPPLTLADSTIDTGRARGRMSVDHTTLIWSTPIRPITGHHIWTWYDLHQNPELVDLDDVQVLEDGLRWRVPHESDIVAIAIADQDLKLASICRTQGILDALESTKFDPRLISLLRWLKAPILKQRIRERIEPIAFENSAQFAIGWLNGDDCWRAPSGDSGMYTVTRSLLWDCTLDKQDITRLARQLGDNPAERLAEISPGLFWSWAKLNGYKPQDADPRWDIPFHREAVAALRDCFLRGQRASGLGASIDRKLRRLAESATGRQYLCSQLMR